MEKQLLSTCEIATLLRKSVPGVQRAIRLGQIPGFKIGRRFYIDEEVFNRWIETEMSKNVNGGNFSAEMPKTVVKATQ